MIGNGGAKAHYHSDFFLNILMFLQLIAFAISNFTADNLSIAIDKNRTAVLNMDYQNDIINFLPEIDREPLLAKASTLLTEVRRVGMPVIYIVVHLQGEYPEISSQNKMFGG